MAARPRSTFATDPHWPYGRIWYDDKGQPTYHIRVRLGGKLYQTSTRRHSVEAAIAEYRRFELDPDGYDPRGDVGPDALYLDAKLVLEFLTWSKHKGKSGKGNTPEWVAKQRQAMTFWIEKLHGLDLRAGGRRGQVSLTEHIDPALRRPDGKDVEQAIQRTRVLKTFYAWLRRVRRSITPAEDPTLDTLSVPRSEPAILSGRKRIVADGEFWKVHEQLEATEAKEARFREDGTCDCPPKVKLRGHHHSLTPRPWADMMLVLGGTGWHVTELLRWMRGQGEVHPIPAGTEGEGGAGVLVVFHKTRKPHPERVSERVLETAKRLLGRGGVNRGAFEEAVKQACEDAKVKPFTVGALRHKYITYALTHGATLSAAGDAVGHGSITTTGIYRGYAATKKVPSLV